MQERTTTNVDRVISHDDTVRANAIADVAFAIERLSSLIIALAVESPGQVETHKLLCLDAVSKALGIDYWRPQ